MAPTLPPGAAPASPTVTDEGTTTDRPLGSYSALIALFLTIFGGGIAAASARTALPERLSFYDLALAGIGGHKLSRLIVTDDVTAPLRVPFVTVTTNAAGELEERPRGGGMRAAIGKLVTCPSCVGQWATAAFVTGLIVAPRPTRAAASIFVADTISDFLHVAYRASKDRA